ncbi:protein kinase [Xylona heveae TC161]|uniref:EKC/KEOPS complex subunit BUD32 n=1 Tax=Xylona heveae (strain CBS 132557 / TC161) TaxID=1328760 RepID=A0A165JY43_XYLHT|nr:protein kinase [Xylona heveae TC161]KZF26771.1 protein kinase [Xylona heveae TC161]
MDLIRRAARRSLLSLRSKPAPVPRAGRVLPQDERVDEEICPFYNFMDYYPAKPGEILADRYQLVVKIGWGTRSTVWLARDIRRYKWQVERFAALKINELNSEEAQYERDIEDHIAKKDPLHPGYPMIRTCIESFEITRPEGSHICLAYEPMREPFWLYQRHFRDDKLPFPVVKAYFLMLLAGLDYLHSECRVIHTDLRLENILVGFENQAVIEDFVKAQIDDPMEYKINASGQTVYRRHNYFGPLRKLENLPKIIDFGSSCRIDNPKSVGMLPIQPDHYRAPEVILGRGWTFSTDIWNLGVLMWDILENTQLFQQAHDTTGHYDAKAHLAEMIALLGPPPKTLLEKADAMLRVEWPDAIQGEGGKLCRNAQQLFGGPFFSGEGKFLYPDLIPARQLKDTLPSLEKKDREELLSFVKKMLTWLPEERKTARELMEDPFLTRSSKLEKAWDK